MDIMERQTGELRQQHMLEALPDKPFLRILEIGAWAGLSTRFLADAVRDRGIVFTIDHFQAAPNSPQVMKDAVEANLIFPAFLENTRGAKNIFLLKGTSDEIMPTLAPVFDYIFIDGDHSYSQFSKDLAAAKRILAPGGVICGDDLELQWKDITQDYCLKHLEDDCIQDLNTGRWYHPGVTYGLKDENVEEKDGFWKLI